MLAACHERSTKITQQRYTNSSGGNSSHFESMVRVRYRLAEHTPAVEESMALGTLAGEPSDLAELARLS